MLSFGAGDDGGPTEPLVPMALGLAYATAGVGLVYGLLAYSTTVRWAFLAGTVLLVPASLRVVSAYRLRRRDVAALGGLVLLLVLYVLYLQIDRHLELFPPYVLAAATFVVPVLAGAAFGYETRRLPAARTGPNGYLRGLSRYVAVGVVPSMVTSGFVGSATIGTAGRLSRTEYVLIYTVTGLLMTAVAVCGASVGYTAGYAIGRRGGVPD